MTSPASRVIAMLRESGVDIATGLSTSEIAQAEAFIGCRFPPDLASVLALGMPVGERFPNWRNLASEALAEQLQGPTLGVLFDVGNGFWMSDWPARPDATAKAVEVARAILAETPKLIPVYAHRYLASQPCEAGNPVLSVKQTDIIYYGADLEEYVRNEFVNRRWRSPTEIRRVPFWSAIADSDW